MESIIRLFKAVEVLTKQRENPSKELLQETIKKGFVFSPKVVYNYSRFELAQVINVVEKELGLTAEKMNSSFHKSWGKVKEASIIQLVLEQLVHYFTTYGFESMGIYSQDSVYIPSEKLEIPELEEGISLTVIKGYTKDELKSKLIALLQSGIALAEDTLKDVVDLATYLEITAEEISTVKNKEARVMLYGYLDLIPKNPVEFLRYAIYKSTNKTLLIKDNATIEEIKSKDNLNVLNVFLKYGREYGFERLAEIFLRFKPLFLAFRSNQRMKVVTNRIRRLAKKYHQPMPSDYLNEITSRIKNGIEININELEKELSKANAFRKIRLAYALKFRTGNVDSILYRIRNGKGYATSFEFQEKATAQRILEVVLSSIVKGLDVKDKKIYIPDYVTYALPATEKQFTGDFPSGTYIKIPKDMIVGIHWENVGNNRIDIDLSMVNAEGKFGWDADYRSSDRSVLFSGDMTNAKRPNGASEFFYVARQEANSYILFANYYNFEKDIEVPLKVIVAKERVENLSKNYMVNPNNVIAIAKTKITQMQKILGFLVTTLDESRFYFAETYLGRSITSCGSEFVEHSRKYLFDFYSDTISLNDVLGRAGAIMVSNREDCDIDLSPERLEKDKIISLIC